MLMENRPLVLRKDFWKQMSLVLHLLWGMNVVIVLHWTVI